ncbi:hypothetical protein EDD17DRAFT_85266 [Pisolithus thermaeus]|nr:hypothetical protein EDD17DRAFT_85266 [Pisolithus thermaeus]
MRAAGIDLDESYCPVISSVSSADHGMPMDWVNNQDDLAVAYSYTREKYLALHQPKAVSLPANKHISLQLRASSARLTGKHLVTTVVQCSDFYAVDKDGKRVDSGDNSTPDSGDHFTEARISNPLCITARPQVWSREPLCEQRKEQFKNIRV